MDEIKLRVVKACWLLGRIAETGSTLKVPAADAIAAVNSGRCEPVDEYARAELRVAAAVERDRLLAMLARGARR